DELAGYLQTITRMQAEGETLADAFRVALHAILTSRNFIYLVEGDPEPRERLTDVELASRLSYFLWSSMPDQTLLDAAADNQLSGQSLRTQLDRLLADSRLQRFVDDFARQWLQLHRVGMFPPDRKLYPVWDDWLQKSLQAEPVEYFREVLTQNLPLESFL
ncbi:MAG: DUF1592 domain-containing protein, partial [Planctomyces sp.]